jgi:hypothetical protein
MNQHYRAIIVPAGFLSVALAASFLGGCAQTAAPEPNIIERAQAGTPPPPPPTGFLGGDYALLKPAGAGPNAPSIIGIPGCREECARIGRSNSRCSRPIL